MHLWSGRDLGHLTYCTNIHAGEPLEEVMRGLERHLPAIKTAVAPDRPLGVGLRLGHQAAEGLRDPGALAELKRFLAAGGYYVFTLNGFPYGAFHGRAVKEDAYKPDWSDPLRLSYTDYLADILSELLPAGQDGSVSTVPCTFKPWAAGRMEAVTDHLIRHVAHLVGIAHKTGQTIALALEPEPCCLLETIDETVEFFNARLFDRKGVARLAALTGLGAGAAEAAMRRHIGVCYDVCHAAVEFEDPKASVAQLRAHGILIAKLQLSSALKVAALDQDSARHLAAFAEPVYLHQVVQKSKGRLSRFVDLPQALAQADGAAGAEWRVHFHVPVFLEQMMHFGTTQSFLAEILAQHRAEPISPHLEVETYTWDVLPESYRKADLSSAIARELNWVKAQLLQ
ncbi:MAG: metabolite traffic protein EboE [Proteobacteria bacterium]|nr:metabolite traffic protein EboE [Pseudomonadota bacterium]